MIGNLAISTGHNASVAVEANGKILGVVEFERFLSIKNVGFLNYKPVNDPKAVRSAILNYIKKEYGISEFDKLYLSARRFKSEMVYLNFHKIFKQIIPVDHHEAHAYCAFYQSNYKKALVVSFDGGGNDSYFNIYLADREAGLKKIEALGYNFGLPYMSFGYYFKDINPTNTKDANLIFAGKIMGLCAYGTVVKEWVPYFKDYYYALSKHNHVSANSIENILNERIGKYIGLYFNVKYQFKDKLAWDIAATSQKAFEEVFFEVTNEILGRNKRLPLCLTGDCALNIILNTQLKNKRFNVFVPPNPNDCGLAAGMILKHLKPKKAVDLTYSGIPLLDLHCLQSYFQNNNGTYYDLNILSKDLAKGNIIGVARGNSEHGPRALGNRSILCSPLIGNMKDILNSKVKNREWYRPFAPVVRLEDVSEYFEWEGESRWMSFCPKVRDKFKTIIPAITHVDGTARVQTVTREQNEFLYDLLTNFKEESGFGILLNTSFNVDGRPMVTTCSEAFDIYLKTQIDGLLLENYYFSKNET